MHILANRIKKIRFEAGLNQEIFAERVRAHRSTVSRWESGLSEPRPHHLVLIAAIARTTVDELLQGLEELAA